MAENLLTPGPTPLPPRVAEAMRTPMINHRSDGFDALAREVMAGLQSVFQTRHDVIVMPSSGTGALESAIVNTLSPGDRVLACTVGAFGDWFAQAAEAHGAVVERLEGPWGQATDPHRLAERLEQDNDHTIKAILLTHNETSTGVTNLLAELAGVCRRHPALRLVDAVSSAGAIEIKMDEWELDVMVTGTQKALMCPPGLGIVAVGPRARKAAEQARMSRFYFDWRGYTPGTNRVPYTPALSLYYGLREALAMMQEDGLPRVFQRHARVAAFCREGVKRLGLELFADERFASDSVTAVRAPAGIELAALHQAMRRRGVMLAGGLGKAANSLFRIGHMGYISEENIRNGLAALAEVLQELRR